MNDLLWIGNREYMGVWWVAYLLTEYMYFLLASKVHPALMAFSFRRNWQKLISIEKSEGDIPILHGVRAVHVLALLLSHKSVAMLYSPYANRTDISKVNIKPFCVKLNLRISLAKSSVFRRRTLTKPNRACHLLYF